MERPLQPPLRLFKYVGQAGIEILVSKTLRFTRPSLLNDPFEVRPFLKTVGDEGDWSQMIEAQLPKTLDKEINALPPELQRLLSRNALLQEVRSRTPDMLRIMQHVVGQAMPKMNHELYGSADSLIGILSLTERPHDLLMWSHYGDCHRGMVIEFDASHAFFNRRRGPEDEFYHLRPVTYSHQRPQVDLLRTDFAEWFLRKSKAWEYEAEWRMLAPLRDCKTISPTIHVQSFPPECVRRIILGANSSKEFRDGIHRIVLGSKEFCHIRILFAKLQTREYALEISETES